jgi:UDP-N-acetylglucosamine--N-acetylmuramyl-(pentapeptide) pyrophosphoryl-undecaprenol N-acetylglucosamine transferase
VTDDHQTKNARVLSDLGAAILVSDKEANDKLIEETLALLKDTKKQAEMQMKLKDIAKPQATETIVKVIVECIGKRG